jgi:plasmid stabilization system protein ParE
MSWEVILTDHAHAQMHVNYQWWAKNRSIEQANRWFNLFAQKISSLSSNAERCSRSTDSKHFPCAVRDLYFGLGKKPTHRAVFTIRGDKVVVLAIRHLAQDDLKPDDLLQ